MRQPSPALATRRVNFLPSFLAAVFAAPAVTGCSSPPPPPPDHVTLHVSQPRHGSGFELRVLINNKPVGTATGGETNTFSFPAQADGNNTVEFVWKGEKGSLSSGKREVFATAGAEVNMTVYYWYKDGGLFGKDTSGWDIDSSIVKQGDPPSITDATIAPETLRREAARETVRGAPGYKFAISRKRTVERQITLSESAKTELTLGAKVGYGLVEVSASIKATLARKDTVMMRDKEEITQSIEGTVGSSGTATLVWVDYVKKGKAKYKFNGVVKDLEFEVVYSSELTVLKGE